MKFAAVAAAADDTASADAAAATEKICCCFTTLQQITTHVTVHLLININEIMIHLIDVPGKIPGHVRDVVTSVSGKCEYAVHKYGVHMHYAACLVLVWGFLNGNHVSNRNKF